MKKSEIRDIVKKFVSSLIDEKLHYASQDGADVWMAHRPEGHFSFVVVYDRNVIPEGAGASFQITFRHTGDKRVFLANQEKSVKFFKIPKDLRKQMIENYAENYTNSLREAGLTDFKISNFRKFVLLTQRDTSEVSFENPTQLKELLPKLIPQSLEEFWHFVEKRSKG